MTRIQIRRGTSFEWEAANPILYQGEFGLETDTNQVKLGDGTSFWNSLGYVSLDWNTLAGKPTYVAAGSTKAAARLAIEAEYTGNKGQPDGYASLDGSGKVPVTQLPNAIMAYLGVWDADTNSPALADGTGNAGDVYRVSVAGSQNLGAGSVSFNVGDYVIYSGTVWEKADTTDAVTSVAGRTGEVTLSASDVGLANVDNTSDADKNSATATLTNKTISGSSNTLTNIAQTSITGLSSTLAGKEDKSAKGAANGYASLDGDGLVPQAQLPITTASWTSLDGKPAVVAAGATEADARDAIEAEWIGNKGQPNGYASLDASGYIPLAQWGAQVVDCGTASSSTTDVIDGGAA